MILPIRTEQDILRLRAEVKTRFESDLVDTLVAHRNVWLRPVEVIYHTAKALLEDMKSDQFEPGRIFLWNRRKGQSLTETGKTPESGIVSGSEIMTPTQQGPSSDGTTQQSSGKVDDL